MADLGLDEKEMNIILKEFIYGERMGGGENKSNEIEKLEVVKSLLTSSRYKDMVENLIMEHFYADNNNITSANIYDHFGTAYLFWLISTGKTELVKLHEDGFVCFFRNRLIASGLHLQFSEFPDPIFVMRSK